MHRQYTTFSGTHLHVVAFVNVILSLKSNCFPTLSIVKKLFVLSVGCAHAIACPICTFTTKSSHLRSIPQHDVIYIFECIQIVHVHTVMHKNVTLPPPLQLK